MKPKKLRRPSRRSGDSPPPRPSTSPPTKLVRLHNPSGHRRSDSRHSAFMTTPMNSLDDEDNQATSLSTSCPAGRTLNTIDGASGGANGTPTEASDDDNSLFGSFPRDVQVPATGLNGVSFGLKNRVWGIQHAPDVGDENFSRLFGNHQTRRNSPFRPLLQSNQFHENLWNRQGADWLLQQDTRDRRPSLPNHCRSYPSDLAYAEDQDDRILPLRTTSNNYDNLLQPFRLPCFTRVMSEGSFSSHPVVSSMPDVVRGYRSGNDSGSSEWLLRSSNENGTSGSVNASLGARALEANTDPETSSNNKENVAVNTRQDICDIDSTTHSTEGTTGPDIVSISGMETLNVDSSESSDNVFRDGTSHSLDMSTVSRTRTHTNPSQALFGGFLVPPFKWASDFYCDSSEDESVSDELEDRMQSFTTAVTDLSFGSPVQTNDVESGDKDCTAGGVLPLEIDDDRVAVCDSDSDVSTSFDHDDNGSVSADDKCHNSQSESSAKCNTHSNSVSTNDQNISFGITTGDRTADNLNEDYCTRVSCTFTASTCLADMGDEQVHLDMHISPCDISENHTTEIISENQNSDICDDTDAVNLDNSYVDEQHGGILTGLVMSDGADSQCVVTTRDTLGSRFDTHLITHNGIPSPSVQKQRSSSLTQGQCEELTRSQRNLSRSVEDLPQVNAGCSDANHSGTHSSNDHNSKMPSCICGQNCADIYNEAEGVNQFNATPNRSVDHVPGDGNAHISDRDYCISGHEDDQTSHHEECEDGGSDRQISDGEADATSQHEDNCIFDYEDDCTSDEELFLPEESDETEETGTEDSCDNAIPTRPNFDAMPVPSPSNQSRSRSLPNYFMECPVNSLRELLRSNIGHAANNTSCSPQAPSSPPPSRVESMDGSECEQGCDMEMGEPLDEVGLDIASAMHPENNDQAGESSFAELVTQSDVYPVNRISEPWTSRYGISHGSVLGVGLSDDGTSPSVSNESSLERRQTESSRDISSNSETSDSNTSSLDRHIGGTNGVHIVNGRFSSIRGSLEMLAQEAEREAPPEIPAISVSAQGQGSPISTLPPDGNTNPRADVNTGTHRSHQSDSSDDDWRSNWYFYDHRLVPVGRLAERIDIQSHFNGVTNRASLPGIMSPPSYEEVMSESSPYQPVLSPSDIPPPLPDVPPPPYSLAPPPYTETDQHMSASAANSISESESVQDSDSLADTSDTSSTIERIQRLLAPRGRHILSQPIYLPNPDDNIITNPLHRDYVSPISAGNLSEQTDEDREDTDNNPGEEEDNPQVFRTPRVETPISGQLTTAIFGHRPPLRWNRNHCLDRWNSPHIWAF